MKTNTLPGTQIQVTAQCLGTMIFGEQLDESASHAVMNTAIKEHGINFLDTAELYPVPMREQTYGRTDEIIGSWLKNNPTLRPSLVIASKVIAYADGLKWFRGGPLPTKEHFSECLNATLQRLGVDYLDLFQIHWPSRNTPLFGARIFDPCAEKHHLNEGGVNLYEQAEAMDSFIKAGKIRAWGVCNENPWGLMKFLQICKDNHLHKPCTIQNAYNLLNRTFEPDLHEVCVREKVGLLVYSPLAFGHLTGKYLTANPQNAAGRLSLYPSLKGRYHHEHISSAVKAYQDIAHSHSLKLTDMALAFVNSQSFVTSNIIGASNPNQVHSNVKSLEVELSDKILSDIYKIHCLYRNPAP